MRRQLGYLRPGIAELCLELIPCDNKQVNLMLLEDLSVWTDLSDWTGTK